MCACVVDFLWWVALVVGMVYAVFLWIFLLVGVMYAVCLWWWFVFYIYLT